MKLYKNTTNVKLTIVIDLGSGQNEEVVLFPGELINLPDYITKHILDQVAPHLQEYKEEEQIQRKKRAKK